MRLILSLAFFLLIIYSKSFSSDIKKDYFEYNIKINEAEEAFFVNNDMKTYIKNYEYIFDNFDFIFAKDIINFFQIQALNNNYTLINKYISKAFENGIKPIHFEENKVFEKYRSSNKINLDSIYNISRIKYYQRLHFLMITNLYSMYVNDQYSKRCNHILFDSIVNYNSIHVFDSLSNGLFYSEKNTGIPSLDIFKSTGNNKKYDILNYNLLLKNCYWKLDSTIEYELYNEYLFVISCHKKCFYTLNKSKFNDMIKLGLIHPREVALLSDFETRDNKGIYHSSICNEEDIKHFNILLFYFFPKENLDFELANKVRKANFICSLECDFKKYEYQEKNKIRLFYGFMNSI